MNYKSLLLSLAFTLSLPTLAAESFELIPDPAMSRGVKMLAPKAVNGVGVPIDTLRFDNNRKHPLWNLCSWDFKTGLSSRNPQQDVTYGIAYADDAFMFARNEEGVFTMRVDASKVYEEHRTSGSDPWINFLVETSFDGVEVGKTKSLTFSYEMRVISCINRMDSAYDTSIHAAQFLGYQRSLSDAAGGHPGNGINPTPCIINHLDKTLPYECTDFGIGKSDAVVAINGGFATGSPCERMFVVQLYSFDLQ